MNLADAMERAQVLDFELQKQLVPLMRDMVPLPGIYDPSFIAANQAERADNVIKGTKREQVGAAVVSSPPDSGLQGWARGEAGHTTLPWLAARSQPTLHCMLISACAMGLPQPPDRLPGTRPEPLASQQRSEHPSPCPCCRADGDRSPAHPRLQGRQRGGQGGSGGRAGRRAEARGKSGKGRRARWSAWECRFSSLSTCLPPNPAPAGDCAVDRQHRALQRGD